MRGRRLLTTLAAAGVSAALTAAPVAEAEEVFTGQAAAARATDATWIPAPQRRAAVCVVDTGNDANADTANVVARFAVDGGDGGDLHPDRHGTLMAMIASAPHNGFGMVGAAPSVDVVSVRASRDGSTFGSLDVMTAIQTCVSYRNVFNVRVISLSLGGQITRGLDAASMSATQDAVDNARRAGLDVVAAAGNRPGPVDWPAGYGPVLAVGASAADGGRCPFAASGPEVDLWALGCPQDVALPDGRAAWASGSSEATAFVAGVLAELRGLRPALTVDEAERALTENAPGTPAGPALDVDAAFRAAGLDAALAAGHAAIPGSDVTPSGAALSLQPAVAQQTAPAAAGSGSAAPTSAPSITPIVVRRVRLPMPRVRSLRLRRGMLSLALANRPAGAQVRVHIYVRRRRCAFPTKRTLTSAHDRMRTRVLGTLSELSIIYRDPTGGRLTSAAVSVRPRR